MSENNNNRKDNDITRNNNVNIEETYTQKKQNLVLAVIGLILGVLGIPLICVWFMGIPVGALGIALCLLSRPKGSTEPYSEIASAGIVVGLLAVVGGFAFLTLSWVSAKMSL